MNLVKSLIRELNQDRSIVHSTVEAVEFHNECQKTLEEQKE